MDGRALFIAHIHMLLVWIKIKTEETSFKTKESRYQVHETYKQLTDNESEQWTAAETNKQTTENKTDDKEDKKTTIKQTAE